jgi:4'-phosphopantetheinyl transferase EntD
LTHQWLDFHQAVISIDPATRTFVARLLVAGPVLAGRSLERLDGRWLMRDGLILTAATVPANLT